MLTVIGLNGTGHQDDCDWYLGRMDKNKEAVTKYIMLHIFSKERTNRNL